MSRPHMPQERTSQILEAAMTLFARDGFDKARMDDIAEAAGLSKGTLYLYFDNKDALIAAILRQFFDAELTSAQEIFALDIPIPERLLALTQHLAAEVTEMSALLSIGFEFYAVAARQKSVRDFLQDYFRRYTHVIAALLQQGIARGEIRDTDPQMAALTVIALLEGLNLLYVVDADAASWAQHAENAIRLLLEGLQTQKTSY